MQRNPEGEFANLHQNRHTDGCVYGVAFIRMQISVLDDFLDRRIDGIILENAQTRNAHAQFRSLGFGFAFIAHIRSIFCWARSSLELNRILQLIRLDVGFTYAFK